ncbi:MAG: sugar transferase [Acetivibrionales bacterium]|jgi:exopolysaccharide biosynthesis polyprenyl glycosylphosphotransferase
MGVLGKNVDGVQSVVDQRALFYSTSFTYRLGKRLFDIALSLIAIIFLVPVFLVIALLIKLTSPGPVIFSQERSGFKGRVFRMYKFRSMVVDAEKQIKRLEGMNEVSGPMFKIRNDPRITAVGKVIRKTSLDELPQLFNILKGDMSIVGPRPPIVGEVVKYDTWHKLRLSVRPGLTGLWQISGRNSLGFEEMIRLDLKYIKERSFWYDLRIILRTIPTLLGDSNAY